MYSKFELETTKKLTNFALKILDANYEKQTYHKLSKTHVAILQSLKTRAVESAPEVSADVWKNSW